MDYCVLTGINECEEKIKITEMRSFLSINTYKILQFSISIKDEQDMELEEIFHALRKFIRTKRNILLDRVEFERCRQKESENFESFFIMVQKTAIDANLCKDHCNACKKLCLEARIANKIMAGLKDSDVRTKLVKLGEDDFSLENIVKICRTKENSKKNERKLAIKSSINQLIRLANEYQIAISKARQGRPTQRHGRSQSNERKNLNTKEIKGCKNCGAKHENHQCRAKDKNVMDVKKQDITSRYS